MQIHADTESINHDNIEACLRHITFEDSQAGNEREALIEVNTGFHLRPPRPPHELQSYYTPEDDLFQTIHMGAAAVDKPRWKLVIDGLVEKPLSITWNQLIHLPKEDTTAFHECYGSPIKPPVENLWRIGNVVWSGVPLQLLLDIAKPKSEAKYVWSDGLEHGSFSGTKADRYQKDMPLSKALSGGVLVAYEMNGEPLGKERGGPVRLVVPGFFGTNSTKWLCRLSLQETRSRSPFTTIYYNEIDPSDPDQQRKRPCWEVEPNSFLLTKPASEGEVQGPHVTVTGRAWAALGIQKVSISVLHDGVWIERAVVPLKPRSQYEWQFFEGQLSLLPGRHRIMAQATDLAGTTQPISGRRNHAHQIEVAVN